LKSDDLVVFFFPQKSFVQVALDFFGHQVMKFNIKNKNKNLNIGFLQLFILKKIINSKFIG